LILCGNVICERKWFILAIFLYNILGDFPNLVKFTRKSGKLIPLMYANAVSMQWRFIAFLGFGETYTTPCVYFYTR